MSSHPRSGKDGAVAFAQKHGIEIPKDVVFQADPKLPPDAPATYGEFSDRIKIHEFDELRRGDGKIVVRVRPDVLQSDEAILFSIGHEMEELRTLKRIFEENDGSISRYRIEYLIKHPHGSIH